MGKNFQKYTIIASVMAAAVLVALSLFLYRVVKAKKDVKVYDRLELSVSTSRAIIFDRNRNILSMDMPENILSLNVKNLKSDDDFEKVEPFLLEQFNILDIESLIKNASDGFSVVDRNIDAMRRKSLEEKIASSKLDKFLSFHDTVRRVYAYDAPFFKRFIGSVDSVSRKGVSGVEQLMDEYLQSSETTGRKELKGSDVVLSVDLQLCRNLESISEYQTSLTHVLVFDGTSGELIALCDNAKESDSFRDNLFSFPDISKSPVFNSIQVVAMLEKDPTLLEEYYCNGTPPCTTSHGLVNLNNLIYCPTAIANMRQNNYKNSELIEYIAAIKVNDKDLSGLMRLAFISADSQVIPALTCVHGIEKHDRNDLWKGIDPSEGILLSPLSSSYLRKVLQKQGREICVFPVKNFFAVIYQDGGIQESYRDEVEALLNNYYL